MMCQLQFSQPYCHLLIRITKSHKNLKYPKIRFQSFIKTEHTLDGCVVGRNLYNIECYYVVELHCNAVYVHGYRERRNLLERVLQCHCSPVHHLRCMDQPIQSILLQLLCYQIGVNPYLQPKNPNIVPKNPELTFCLCSKLTKGRIVGQYI